MIWQSVSKQGATENTIRILSKSGYTESEDDCDAK